MDTVNLDMLPLSEEQLTILEQSLNQHRSRDELVLADLKKTLDAILTTACCSSVYGGHSFKAVTTLCAFLRTLQSSEYHSQLLWKDAYWIRCFDVVLEKTDSTKAKPMRRLLTTLIAELERHKSSGGDIFNPLYAMLTPLRSQGDRGKMKPALQALLTLLSQGLVDVDDITHMLLADAIPRNFQPSAIYQRLFRKLFEWAILPELTHVAGRVISKIWALLRNQLQNSNDELIDDVFSAIWIRPLMGVLANCQESIPRFKSHIFPDLFLVNCSDYKMLLKALGFYRLFSGNSEPAAEIEEFDMVLSRTLVFYVLDVGKQIGYISDNGTNLRPSALCFANLEDIGDTSGQKSRVSQDIKIGLEDLQSLLIDESSSVRISALSLVIGSAASTKPYSDGSFRALQKALPGIITECDAGVRADMLVQFHRFIDRTRTVTALLDRRRRQAIKMDSVEPDSTTIISINRQLDRHERFVVWLLHYIYLQLHPGAGYQKVVFSLKLLKFLCNSGLDPQLESGTGSERWGFRCKIMSPSLIRALLTLTMNRFEDVRSTASELLQLGFDPSPFSTDDNYLVNCLETAEAKMLRSGRADHADGVSRFYSIIFRFALHTDTEKFESSEQRPWWNEKMGIILHLTQKLERALQQAATDMAMAISKSPMHGVISSLRLILDSAGLYSQIKALPSNYRMLWAQAHLKICNQLTEVWNTVQNVLCNDAPEGHVPEDLEDAQNLSTKDVLSYSWRALAETSALIRVVVSKATLSQNENSGAIDFENLEQLTNLTFSALTDLRHRGAFSAVALAFEACCVRYKKEEKESNLVDLYERSLRIIQNKGSTTTRRSAGIPSIVLGVLSADPKGPLFSRAMRELKELAAELPSTQANGMSLPQVHAMNSLRAVFRSSTLGEPSEKHIPDCLVLASNCLTSNIWAIRNCGLMLFRALVDQLLGSSESHNSIDTKQKRLARLSWSQYPELERVLTQLIDGGIDPSSTSRAIESVFPALKMIQTILPPRSKRDNFCRAVLKLCQSSHWHVRDMAARTFCNLAQGGDLIITMDDLLPNQVGCQNDVHGRLLCVYYILKSWVGSEPLPSTDDVSKLWEMLYKKATALFWSNSCPFTQSEYLRILNLLLCYSLRQRLGTDFVNTPTPFWTILMPASHPVLRKEAELHRILINSQLENCGRLDHSPDVSNLVRLADLDANACFSVLNELRPLLRVFSDGFQSQLFSSLWQILSNNRNDGLIFIAETIICQIIDQRNSLPDTRSQMLVNIRHKFVGNLSLPPSITESRLGLWSKCLQHSLDASSLPPQAISEEVDYILRTIHPLVDELMPFTIRMSAVQALRNLSTVTNLPNSAAFQSIKLKYLFLLYDCLNDDNEDIRELAAKVVDFRPGDQPQGSVYLPIIASNQILSMITAEEMHSKMVTDEAIKRLTVTRFEAGVLQPKASTTFRTSLKDDEALFAVEKQNLYVDDFRESMAWAKVLRRFVPTSRQFRILECWTLDGLKAVNAAIIGRSDGPLGWSSKPEVFFQVARIINASGVLLFWAGKQHRRTDVLLELMHFTVFGEQNHIHKMLLTKAENILQQNIIQGLQRMKERLTSAIPNHDNDYS